MQERELPTPCFIIDMGSLCHNLEILEGVQHRTGCKILLAQKAFALFPLYPLMGRYLAGTAASGLFEARLGKEKMQKESHVFSAAYRPDEFEELLHWSDHIVFNSLNQLHAYGPRAKAAGKSVGLRINPECSTQQGHALYDPCAPHSRLGVTAANWREEALSLLDGLHFHTLCEQNSDALETTLAAFEHSFGHCLSGLSWLNLGGGHHITRPGYDLERLERCVMRLREKYGVMVYLEPGEAVALSAGELHTTVLDTLCNGMNIAILDTSAACHMPDVLEMPYRPPLTGSSLPGEKRSTWRLGGPTCLAGDLIGDYSFDEPLRIGDRLVFNDMAIYTMVKTNTFNGMPLPTIALRDKNGDCHVMRRFGYDDFKSRLG